MSAGGERTRLSGWKEIANYLDVTVRTAQLWERNQGLPVHRLSGGARARVHAYTDELEMWLQGRSEPPSKEANAQERDAGALSARVGLLIVISATVVVLGAAALWSLGRQAPIPVNCELERESILVRGADGQIIWQRRPEGVEFVTMQAKSREGCRVVDIDGDGRPEVLAQVENKGRSTQPSGLMVFEGTGEVRWFRAHGRELRRGDRVFPQHYLGYWTRRVELAKKIWLISCATHVPFYPTEVALLDPATGEAAQVYYHPGYLHDARVTSLDEDEDPELLLTGINNPGPGIGFPVLLALDLPFAAPVNRQPGESINIFGLAGPTELFYYVIPRLAISELTDSQTRVKWMRWDRESRLNLNLETKLGNAILSLDLSDTGSPRPEGISPSSQLRVAYSEAVRRGELLGEFDDIEPARFRFIAPVDTAPDGNSQQTAEIMSALIRDEPGHAIGSSTN